MADTILVTYLIIGIIDTLIGNAVFPMGTEMLKIEDKYYIKRRHRIMLIPFWRWVSRSFSQSTLDDYSFSFKNAEELIQWRAQEIYDRLTGAKLNKAVVVQSSKEKMKGFDYEEMKRLDKLLQKTTDPAEERKILEQLKKLHSI